MSKSTKLIARYLCIGVLVLLALVVSQYDEFDGGVIFGAALVLLVQNHDVESWCVHQAQRISAAFNAWRQA